jgi:putative spermidine/putrescine transport system substrate-binding protein
MLKSKSPFIRWSATGLSSLLALLLLAGTPSSPARAEQVTLRITTNGGDFEQFENHYLGERFTAETGIKIQWVEANPPDELQKLIASRGRPVPFDVAQLDDKTQPEAIAAGTLAKIDPAIVTNLANLYDAAKQPDGYGPARLFWSWGLIYNEKAFRENGIPAPTSWEDLWNPKLAGKIAIADITGPGGVDFVLKAAQISGGNETNLVPGLQKIAQLKVHSYYSSSNDIRTKLASGDVWVAPWNNGRSWALIDSGFPGKFIYPKEGGFLHTTTADVVAGTKYPREAQLYINYSLDPLFQLATLYFPYGPVNKSLDQVLKDYPDLAKKVPTGNLAALSTPNWNVIFSNYAALVDQWNRIVKSK